MIKLFKREICALLSFMLLVAIPAFPAYADKYDNIQYSSVAVYESVPVGARLRFQTPPLQKDQKLCYTAGNGEILRTFVAKEPIENADGTVQYRLGFDCCKAGETGVYINWNGNTRMLYSVQVVDDQSKEGFPLSTSFEQIFVNQVVEKIVIIDGNKFEKRQTTDAAKISQFLAKLAPERLYRNCNYKRRLGIAFNVDFYLKGKKGCYRYSPARSFIKVDGFSESLPIGECVEESPEEVIKIIADLYTSLG